MCIKGKKFKPLHQLICQKTPTSHKQNIGVVDIGNFCTRRSGLPVKQPYVKTYILLLKWKSHAETLQTTKIEALPTAVG